MNGRWLLTCAILLSACSPRLSDGFSQLVPAIPEPPQTDADLVLAMVLRRAVVDEKAVPDYGLLPDPSKIVVLQRDTFITRRILPVTDSVRFVLMTLDQIRSFASRYGHFMYLSVGVRVGGDSAQAGASTAWMGSPRNPGRIYLSGGGCSWQFRKRNGQWYFEKSFGCIIS